MRNFIIAGSLILTFWMLSTMFTGALQCRPTYLAENTKFKITAQHVISTCDNGNPSHKLRILQPDPVNGWQFSSLILTPARENPEPLVMYWEAPDVLRYKSTRDYEETDTEHELLDIRIVPFAVPDADRDQM